MAEPDHAISGISSAARLNQAAAWLAAATLAAHLVGNPHYGFFRDELYYIGCGRHPAFGYVDQPPLVPLLAAVTQVFGTSLFLLRAVPAQFAALAVLLAAQLARAMGGGAFAMLLAAIGTALAPVLCTFGTILAPDSVQVALWPLGILLVARACREPQYWLAAGAVFGVALQAKYSAAIMATALAGGLLFTDMRMAFVQRAFWAGLVLAALIAAPNAMWQWAHLWPMLEVLRNGQLGKNVILGPGAFLMQQVLMTDPLLAPLWIIGLLWCLVRREWRWLGAANVLLLAMMIMLHGKAYYPAPLYPVLFAAGGVMTGSILRDSLARAAVATQPSSPQSCFCQCPCQSCRSVPSWLTAR